MSNNIKSWDIFISHASEDKELFVRPLEETLQRLDVSVWYDEFTLRLGDSLRKSIDKGLVSSSYAIVVISQNFIKKKWPEYELNGLISREIDKDRVILPIWHGVTRKQVVQFSPSLADKYAFDTERETAQDIAIKILREVRPDLYASHPRAEIERIASGEALRDLQHEFDRVKEELSEYLCPYCDASLHARLEAPFDDEQKHWGVREIFSCGYQVFGSSIEQLCPTDPQFPKFDEYELRYSNTPDESHWQWACIAVARTEMARLFKLSPSYGRTKEEVETKMRESYQRYAKRTE